MDSAGSASYPMKPPRNHSTKGYADVDLRTTINVNREILRLIRTKYEELFPAAYNTPESRYYIRLDRDTTQAEEALKHGGLALNSDQAESD